MISKQKAKALAAYTPFLLLFYLSSTQMFLDYLPQIVLLSYTVHPKESYQNILDILEQVRSQVPYGESFSNPVFLRLSHPAVPYCASA
ncbi:MAG: hypothetical protein ACD_48C00211G0001 [uncultured bacterium]|nr:MAG: hypothetical protein ACD_48C00211G0001 [uncultured bacterium]